MREDLLALGIPEKTVDSRVQRRELFPFMGPGAYLVGHPDPPALAREYAALRLGGDRSVLSWWTAGVLWELTKSQPDGKVHLTLGAQRRSTGTITFHRGSLMRREVLELDDLRVTSPARTIADLAPHLGDGELERVVADAVRRRLLTTAELERYADGRRGSKRLRRVLQLDGGPQWTRSRAEQEFLKLVRRADLPPPRMNRRRGGSGRDALWDDAKVIVEIDGWAFHGDRFAFENDRKRDAARAARGWLTIRTTWRRIRDDPIAFASELAATLALRS